MELHGKQLLAGQRSMEAAQAAAADGRIALAEAKAELQQAQAQVLEATEQLAAARALAEAEQAVWVTERSHLEGARVQAEAKAAELAAAAAALEVQTLQAKAEAQQQLEQQLLAAVAAQQQLASELDAAESHVRQLEGELATASQLLAQGMEEHAVLQQQLEAALAAATAAAVAAAPPPSAAAGVAALEAAYCRLVVAKAKAAVVLCARSDELQLAVATLQHDMEGLELEEQSLLATKAWMTDEIGSLQQDLKEARQQLAQASDRLAAAQAGSAAEEGEPAGGNGKAMRRMSTVAGGRGDKGAANAASQPGSPAGVSSPATAARAASDAASPAAAELQAKLAKAEAQIASLSDQLADVTMQAAVAEASLSSLQEQQSAAAPPSQQVTAGPAAADSRSGTMADIDVMMETVALHGELDELKNKHRTAQAQIDALADMVADAVLQAAHAELSAEGLAIGSSGMEAARAVDGAARSTASAAATAYAAEPAPSAGGAKLAPGPPSADLPRGRLPGFDQPPPEHLGTKPVSPLEQTRMLKQELQQVAAALAEMFEGEQSPAVPQSRQSLSSLRPAVMAAMHLTDNVATTLQMQHGSALATAAAADRDMAPARTVPQQTFQHSSSAAPTWLPADLARARLAYEEAKEMYDLLRADAEDLNSRLWRWGSSLREQLTGMERALSQAQADRVAASSGGSSAGTAALQLVAQKDEYVRQADAVAKVLRADLQAAHARVMRRTHTVAHMQGQLVQLAEQLTQLEGVVVQCEVVSGRIAGKPLHPGSRTAVVA